jgi:teichuronic acid biosynthesis glycosyltransferase TuaC
MSERRPALLVWSSLFPSPAQPQAGIFVRERMFRVAAELPITVLAPQPWFPLQGLIRLRRPHFRPAAPPYERQLGVEVYRPRYFSVPGVDGWFMALAALHTARRLKQAGRLDVIDAHFGYPDGYAAARVAAWLHVPFTVTLRGTEARHSRDPKLRRRLRYALVRAARIFAVAESLRQTAIGIGVLNTRSASSATGWTR